MEFEIVKELPPLHPKAIERAVNQYVCDSHVLGDRIGIVNQTLESIATATFLKGNNDFWLAHEDGEVKAYTIAHVTKSVDNKMTYWVNQSYVDKSLRGNSIVKEWWEKIRIHAKKCFCEHIVIVSSRTPEAYERFLGNGLKAYATLLMEDLED
jgi:hypothetical protein